MSGHGDGGLKDALQLDQAAKDLVEAGAPAAEKAVADQLGLFSGSSVFGTIRQPDGPDIKRVGPGRPRGPSTDTKTLVKLIMAHGKHPLLAMAEIVATPIDVIAKTLGCEKLEAAEYHRKVMSDLAPYVAQKLPTAVQLTLANAGMLVINKEGASLSDQVARLRLVEGEQNQALIDVTPDASHDKASHDEGK